MAPEVLGRRTVDQRSREARSETRGEAVSRHRVKHPLLLDNPIRDYAWGSRTALAELVGQPSPSPRPQAELWMGAHPSAPSWVRVGGRRLTLVELIGDDPVGILGSRVAEEFSGRLPFLLKVLAVERPLSIQVHPDARRAAEGFAREQAAGVPIDAPERCYRDPDPKPELVCALTPFTTLCGFRPLPEIRERLAAIAGPGLRPLVESLREGGPAEGLRRLLGGLLELPRGAGGVLAPAVREAARRAAGDPAFAWVERLAEEHPGDPCALAPALLRLVDLQPGQAMFLPPGRLHAHLQGCAVELMASSDNVLRAGLTDKHVDRGELLDTVVFDEVAPGILEAETRGRGRAVYCSPAREFELETIRVEEEAAVSLECPAASILLCTEGAVRVEAADRAETRLPRGASCLVPAAAGQVRIRGAGRAYRASVPA